MIMHNIMWNIGCKYFPKALLFELFVRLQLFIQIPFLRQLYFFIVILSSFFVYCVYDVYLRESQTQKGKTIKDIKHSLVFTSKIWVSTVIDYFLAEDA